MVSVGGKAVFLTGGGQFFSRGGGGSTKRCWGKFHVWLCIDKYYLSELESACARNNPQSWRGAGIWNEDTDFTYKYMHGPVNIDILVGGKNRNTMMQKLRDGQLKKEWTPFKQNVLSVLLTILLSRILYIKLNDKLVGHDKIEEEARNWRWLETGKFCVALASPCHWVTMRADCQLPASGECWQSNEVRKECSPSLSGNMAGWLVGSMLSSSALAWDYIIYGPPGFEHWVVIDRHCSSDNDGSAGTPSLVEGKYMMVSFIRQCLISTRTQRAS